MNLYSRFSCYSQKLETTQISFSWWMVKQTWVHAYHGVLLGNKGTDYWFIQLGWTSRKFCRVKKPILKHYKLYDSVYIVFLKWHSYRGRGKKGRRMLSCDYKRITRGTFVLEVVWMLLMGVFALIYTCDKVTQKSVSTYHINKWQHVKLGKPK